MHKIHKTYIFLVCISILISGCVKEKQPGVSFDGTKYKFGQVLEGREIVFTFMFSNPGEKNLVITNLEVICFCVHIKEYDRIVPPGEKGKIYGVISTRGFEGDIVKAIKVTTNVPDKDPVILTLEGTVVPRPD